ncbi:heme uptake protein IsdC [Paenibacillus sp. L3-i20]|uniref:heme uptake protein IsdC n=1 Tax=Paenibacillus sp. L3-i20 TaxID=2905833 RepID=UPI001EDF9755|nr:heme uptake protein IsdC [Paenibacillus sp. L3-i20]GKU76755.1 hypothetical protein L3i20_v211520 [Paenibacillus sp. L3-i20]
MKKQIMLCSMLAVLWLSMLIAPGIATAATKLADGTYTADYLILKAENDSVSMANDYWEKPATVTIKDGKAKIRVTINHSFWVTDFKVPGDGGYVDTKVISSNKKADTRIVEFEADIAEPIISKIHVTVAEIDYDHDYTIRFAFDQESFELVKGASKDKPKAKTEKPKATNTPTKTKPEKTNPEKTNPKTAVKTEAVKSTSTDAEVAATVGTKAVKSDETTKPVTVASEATTGSTIEKEASTSSSEKEETVVAGATGTGAETVVEPSAQVNSTAEQKETQPSTKPATDESKDEDRTKKTETVDATSGTEQGEAATGETKESVDLAAVKTLSASGDNSALSDEKSSSGMNWWTPIAAILLLAVGAVFIWRRKTK